jgi:hypothetical protein
MQVREKDARKKMKSDVRWNGLPNIAQTRETNILISLLSLEAMIVHLLTSKPLNMM